MTEKPLSADPEQRAHQTRVSREQSGLPPEPPEPARQKPRADRNEAEGPGEDE